MRRRKFSEEYKREAVKLVIEGGVAVAQAAQDLGLGQSTLEKWVAVWRSNHPQEAPLTLSEREELRDLRKENSQLKLEREILKKAAAYFARASI
jgi:transposase